jgi:uncharacterized membrane protein (DUF4010 family)
MAVLFQLVLFAVHVARTRWGQTGVLGSAVLLGLVDVDALTLSMAKSASAGVPPADAAQAVALGVLSNTVLKLVIALLLGEARFRRLAPAGLAAIAGAAGLSIAILR